MMVFFKTSKNSYLKGRILEQRIAFQTDKGLLKVIYKSIITYCMLRSMCLKFTVNPANISLFKVNNRNTRKR